MNKKCSSVISDISFKLCHLCADLLSLPLTHILNSIFEQQEYPRVWKREYITPVPKVFPPETVKQPHRVLSMRLGARS